MQCCLGQVIAERGFFALNIFQYLPATKLLNLLFFPTFSGVSILAFQVLVATLKAKAK